MILMAHDLEVAGDADQAYSHYCEGIESFIKTVTQLARQHEDKRGLELKVRNHLAKAKHLQQRLDKARISISSLFPQSSPPWHKERPKSDHVIGSKARSRSRSGGARPPRSLPQALPKPSVLVRPVPKARGKAAAERLAPRPPAGPPPAALRAESGDAAAAPRAGHPLAVTKAKALQRTQRPVPKPSSKAKAGAHPIGAPAPARR